MKVFSISFAAAVLALLLVFGVAIGLVALKFESKTDIKDHSWLHLDIYGSLPEYDPPSGITGALTGGDHQTLQSVLTNLEMAAYDKRIDGVVLQLSAANDAGRGKLEEIRRGVARVQEAGKPVLAFADNIDLNVLFTAAACDSFFCPPPSYIFISGLDSRAPHVKRALDKLGIEPHVSAIKDYKSAAQIITREDWTPEARANREWMLDEYMDLYVQALFQGRGIDAQALVQDLRNRGIAVLASGILCMEHHTPDNIQQDIEFLVGLEADFVQFMLLTPLPVTALYRDHQRRGLLRTDLSFQEWHGQKRLSFRHPAFTDDDAEEWITRAFRQDYEENSSSMFRMAETAVRGFEHLAALPNRDACLEARLAQSRDKARMWCLILPAVMHNAVNRKERRRSKDLYERGRQLFGRNLWQRLAGLGTISLAALWKLRLELFGDMVQPRTIVTRYPAAAQVSRLSAGKTAPRSARLPVHQLPPATAAASRIE